MPVVTHREPPAHDRVPRPSRRGLLRGSVGVGTAVVLLTGVRGLAGEAVAGVPTASSRAALAASTACATLTKEETQGPFWVDERLNRSDVRPDTGTRGDGTAVDGVPLTFTLTLQDAGDSCAPQVGAFVDIWHADAQGAYSDVSGSENPDETGHDFLRGYQVSDDAGQVTFTTIWPGWYVSRTIHVHFRVRLALDSSTSVNFTSQLFFDESDNDAVLATADYRKSSSRDTTNADDQLYDAALVMPVTGSVTQGYTGAFTVNLDFGDGTADGGGGSGTGTGTGTDSVVAGSVRAVSVTRRRGTRTIHVAIRGTERLAARIRLLDHDDVLARTTTGWLPVGTHTVTLKVPRATAAGRYHVLVALADKAGNTKMVDHVVRIPARS